ncbi:hypothetical protein GBA52_011783 [Prunus armeniaca]|nr:hypothetical protein GBA52_011783 [Prunus armeniaca]
MMMEVVVANGSAPPHHHHQNQSESQHQQQMHQMIVGIGENNSSGGEGEEQELCAATSNSIGSRAAGGGGAGAPKKRAETWVQEETRSLIGFRREVDGLFNTSKSNRHLWDQISAKMREKGFDRSPPPCVRTSGGTCSRSSRRLVTKSKSAVARPRCRITRTSRTCSEIEPTTTTTLLLLMLLLLLPLPIRAPLLPSSNLLFASVTRVLKIQAFHLDLWKLPTDQHSIWKGSWIMMATLLLLLQPIQLQLVGFLLGIGERVLEMEGGPLFLLWKDYNCQVGEYTRRIGIDGTADAIKEAIKSAFRIRTKRAFWLEDEDQVVRSLDRDMPLGNYTLHLDEGIAFLE